MKRLSEILSIIVDEFLIPLFSWLATSCFTAILALNCMEIVSRTFFNRAFRWVFETNLLLAAFVYFLGIVAVYGRRGDITLAGLAGILPAPWRARYLILVDAISLATFFVVGWYGIALMSLQWPIQTPGLGLPRSMSTLPLVIGTAGLAMVLLRHLVGAQRPPRDSREK